ncbi:MAG: YfhO family protein [Anaerolineae bacterium]
MSSGIDTSTSETLQYRRVSPRLPDGVMLGILALATVTFFWRVVFAGEWMPAGGGDLASFLYPIHHFAAQSLKSGQFPLWNPYLYGGMPFAADIQTALYYPVNLIVWLAIPQVTYRMMMGLAIFHFWLAGAAAYLCFRSLLRRYDAPVTGVWSSCYPALLGALAYMFSDFFVIHFGNLNLIAQAAWLPLIFLFYQRALGERSWRWAIWTGLLLGIAATAGHTQPWLFSVLALLVNTLYHIGAEWYTSKQAEVQPLLPERRASLLLPVGLLLLTLLIGIGLAAVALLPAYELSGWTPRATYDYQRAGEYSLPPAGLIGLFVPSFFGRDPARHWGPWERVEVGYLGILPLVLTMLSVGAGIRRERVIGLLSLLAAFSLLAALGAYSALYGYLYQLVPGLAGMRAPARFVFVFDFALAGLAAYGLQMLMQGTPTARQTLARFIRAAPWILGGLVLIALPLSYYALITSQDKDAVIFARTAAATNGLVFFIGLLAAASVLLYALQRGWVRPVVFGMLGVALTFFDLASLGSNLDVAKQDPSATFHHPGIIAFLQSDHSLYRIDTRTDIWHLWQPDTPLLYNVQDVSGVVNPLILADYARFLEGTPSRSSRLYDSLNVKYVIAARDVVLDWQKFAPVFEGDNQLAVFLNRAALPRAWVVHRARSVPDQAAAWEAVHAPEFDPALEVIVEGGSDLNVTAPRPADIRLDRYALNTLQLRVDMSAEGYLVLSENWYPGWQARVDGEPQAIWRANYAFRALHLSAGQHYVEMYFAPRSWMLGLAITCLTLVSVLIVGVLQPLSMRWIKGLGCLTYHAIMKVRLPRKSVSYGLKGPCPRQGEEVSCKG